MFAGSNMRLGKGGGLGVFLIGKGSDFDGAVPTVPLVRELGDGSNSGQQAGDASS